MFKSYIFSIFVDIKLVYSTTNRFHEKFRLKPAFLSLRAAVWKLVGNTVYGKLLGKMKLQVIISWAAELCYM
jgi:hypothetical protein